MGTVEPVGLGYECVCLPVCLSLCLFLVQIIGPEMCLLVLVCGYICYLFVGLVALLESEITFVDLEKVRKCVCVLKHVFLLFFFLFSHDTGI